MSSSPRKRNRAYKIYYFCWSLPALLQLPERWLCICRAWCTNKGVNKRVCWRKRREEGTAREWKTTPVGKQSDVLPWVSQANLGGVEDSRDFFVCFSVNVFKTLLTVSVNREVQRKKSRNKSVTGKVDQNTVITEALFLLSLMLA